MAGEYLGIGDITFKGRVIKTGDIIQEMSDKEAKNRKQFKPVKKQVTEVSKKVEGKTNEKV
jgi:hypothetical protein